MFNPFYALLVALGIAFALTACAYSVMTLRAVRPQNEEAGGGALIEFLDKHGGRLMAGELALLGMASVGAIATDRYWMQRAYDDYQAEKARQTPSDVS
ncbi:MAG TPA: hypothetical protein VG826_10000 [Pirellulales bacterium]|nr:hypothetical protein [Pirellulales bacterium]